MKSIDDVRHSAALGNADDAWRLACAYFDGCLYLDGGTAVSVRRNSRAGFAWLREAVSLGSADAMIDLAGRLAAGEACAVDLPQAMVLEKQAFELGYELAAYNLAITCSLMSKQKECY